MPNDSFTEFITQDGVINLFIAIFVLGGLWLTLFVWALQRGAERRRRREAGEEPLPNILKQILNTINQQSNNDTGSSMAQASTDAGGSPMTDRNDSLDELPEPDLDDFFSPPSASPKPTEKKESPKPVSATAARPAPPAEPVSVPPIDDIDHIPAIEESTPVNTEAASYIPGSNTIPADAAEIMRVWRDISDGALIIQIGNRIFQTIPELQDKQFARRFIRVVEELARNAQAGAMAAGMQAPDFKKRAAVISQQGDWAKRATPMPQSTQPSTISGGDAENDGPPVLMGTIAEQIEELLQYRLSQTPAFQRRNIHVRSNTDGSLRIEVDNRYYNHVDDVVDPDVREFLQNIIKEWEARQ